MGLEIILNPPMALPPLQQGQGSIGELLLLFLHIIALGFLLVQHRSFLITVNPKQAMGILGLMASCGVLSAVPLVRTVPSLSPPFPFLAPLPILFAARWGIWPGAFVSLTGGLVSFLLTSHSPLYMFQQALFGALVGWLVTLEYTDELPRLLRLPRIAASLAAFLTWPLPFYIFLASLPLYYLAGGWQMPLVELAITFGPVFLEATLLDILWPPRKPLHPGKPSPFARSLTLRVSAYLVLFLLLVSFAFISVVSSLTTQTNLEVLLNTLDRDAQALASLTEDFLNRGREVAGNLALSLSREPPEQWSLILAKTCLTSSLVQSCLVAESNGSVIASYPPSLSLIDEEAQLLSSPQVPGEALFSGIYTLDGEPFVSALTSLPGNYWLMLRLPIARGTLAASFGNRKPEEAFLLDRRGRVIIPPSSPPLPEFPLNLEKARLLRSTERAFYSLLTEQGGWIVVRQPLPLGWQAVITAPYGAIVARVNALLVPFSGFLILVTISLTILAIAFSSRVASPLEELSQRALRLARGHLEESLILARDDEIGQLARALDRMRLTLKARLDDSYSLLRISQKALSVRDLERSMRLFLEGLKGLTKASGAGLALVDKSGLVLNFISYGGIWQEQKGERLSPQSRLVAMRKRPLLIGKAQEASPILRDTLREIGAKAAIGMPLLIGGRLKGVLWLTFKYPIDLTPSEMSLITAIAGQLSVMAENLGLLEKAERERLRLEAILNSTPDPILVLDELGRLAIVNPAAEEMLGIEAERILGLPLMEALRDQNWRGFVEQMNRSTTTIKGEITTIRGTVFHVWASPIIPSGDGAGASQMPQGWVIVLRDITPFKEAERSRTEMLEIVLHDLRSPLTLVQGYVKMLGQVGELNRQQQEIAGKMLRSLDHLTGLVNNFLDISRLETGLRVQLAPCWLRPIVEEAVEEMRDRAAEKSILLELRLPPEPCPFFGDRDFVKRAVINLLDNAIKYTPGPGQVTVSVEDAARFWVLKVQDTGIGIPQADQQRIFEKFYRVKSSEVIRVRGSGLGLALVKSVAERHRGRVWVKSEPGKGSTFYFAIPKARRPSGAEMQ
ncbi:MAG: hypothetical protein DRI61_05865 [Chloroflexi bacterium]|nr:MAG: hypothetical protein DRI61_05865 [Chloroflexota bacterium]